MQYTIDVKQDELTEGTCNVCEEETFILKETEVCFDCITDEIGKAVNSIQDKYGVPDNSEPLPKS